MPANTFSSAYAESRVFSMYPNHSVSNYTGDNAINFTQEARARAPYHRLGTSHQTEDFNEGANYVLDPLPLGSPLEQSLFGACRESVDVLVADDSTSSLRTTGRVTSHVRHIWDQAQMAFAPERQLPEEAEEFSLVPISERIPGAQRLAENLEYLMSGQLPGAPIQVVCLANTIHRTPIVLEDATYESLFGQDCSICRRQFPQDYDEIDVELEYDPPRLQPVRMTTFCCGETVFCTEDCFQTWFDGRTICSICSIMLDDLRENPENTTIRAREHGHHISVEHPWGSDPRTLDWYSTETQNLSLRWDDHIFGRNIFLSPDTSLSSLRSLDPPYRESFRPEVFEDASDGEEDDHEIPALEDENDYSADYYDEGDHDEDYYDEDDSDENYYDGDDIYNQEEDDIPDPEPFLPNTEESHPVLTVAADIENTTVAEEATSTISDTRTNSEPEFDLLIGGLNIEQRS